MLQTARHRQILDLLRDRGECLVDELARECGVSDMTIRRDLAKLADEGRIVRTHGGAASSEQISFEFQFLRRAKLNSEAKERIGAVAAQLVEDGQSIMLDSGTTTLALARNLRHRRQLTVITTSLPIAAVLQQSHGVETLLLGGYIRKESPDLEGPLTESNLESLRADVAFVGADGIDADGVVYNASLGIAKMLSKMVEAAEQVYVVADATKLGRKALASFGNIARWKGLITDAGPDHEMVRQFTAAGMNVMFVNPALSAGAQEREIVHG